MPLQIDEDEKFLQKMWMIERTGWALMFLVIIAALLGFLGNGPLSKAITGEENSDFRIEYNRFERYKSSCQIKFHLIVKDESTGKIKPGINNEFIENVSIQSIKPQPDKVEAAPEKNYYTFNISNPGSITIVYEFEPDKFGNLAMQATFEDKYRLMINQCVYP